MTNSIFSRESALTKNVNRDLFAGAKKVALAGALALSLSACAGMQGPQLGAWGAKTSATGSAGGANSQNASTQLERCEQPIGTVALVERQEPWFLDMQRFGVQSTVPVLRLLAQQSNCFVVVERGRAMASMQMERALRASGELRDNSSFGGGQMVSADYSIEPTLTFSAPDTRGVGTMLGARFGTLGSIIGGSLSLSEASSLITVVDNRSGVQVLVAEGSASGANVGGFLGLGGRKFSGALGTYAKTPEAKVIVAAMMDAFNNVVRSSRGYKEQSIEGGLGVGGGLSVQGSRVNPRVRVVQIRLNNAGYDAGTPDGKMGNRTKTALKSFQRDMGLPESGRIDETTFETLAAMR